MSRGFWIASSTAFFVMALNTTRWILALPNARLCFAVGVGGQDQLVGAFDGVRDFLDPLLGLGVDLPGHRKIFVRSDGAVLGRQIADMAEAGENPVSRPEIFVDGLGLDRKSTRLNSIH